MSDATRLDAGPSRAAEKAARASRARWAAEGARDRLPHPTTAEVDYSPDETEFLLAMSAYTRRTGRKFPTWSEALGVLRDLGYARHAAAVAPPAAEAPPPAGPPRYYTPRKVRSDSKTGARGVTFLARGRYRAQLWQDGKHVNLGCYATEAEATEARDRGYRIPPAGPYEIRHLEPIPQPRATPGRDAGESEPTPGTTAPTGPPCPRGVGSCQQIG